MGGINPVKPPGSSGEQLLPLTQKLSMCIFEASSNFFNAHVALEEAVLREGKRRTLRKSELKIIVKGMSSSKKSCSRALKLLNKNKDLIKEKGTWHQPYMEIIYQHFVSLSKMSKLLSNDLKSDDFKKSFQSGELQKSLWLTGANSSTRRNSLEYLTVLSKLLQAHAEFVEITNRKPKFLK